MDKKLLISSSIFIALVLFYFYDSSKQSSYQDSYTDVFKFDHNKIIFVNGLISNIDLSYEDETKVSLSRNLDFNEDIRFIYRLSN